MRPAHPGVGVWTKRVGRSRVVAGCASSLLGQVRLGHLPSSSTWGVGGARQERPARQPCSTLPVGGAGSPHPGESTSPRVLPTLSLLAQYYQSDRSSPQMCQPP